MREITFDKIIIKWVPCWNEVYYWWFTYKYTNITIKLNWKLLTKVIKRPSEGSLGLDRQSVLIKREEAKEVWVWIDRMS